jgi:F-type H+-transporting ATPase subunit b
MLWINFGILVFLFLKYAKKPLIGFLRGESKKIKEEITDVETQLDKAKTIMESEVINLKDLEGRIQEIRGNIVEIAQREREKTIEQARITANRMMEDVNKESEYKIELAKKTIQDEMMDFAISIVKERLEKGLKPEDDEKLINEFLSGMDPAKRFFN